MKILRSWLLAETLAIVLAAEAAVTPAAARAAFRHTHRRPPAVEAPAASAPTAAVDAAAPTRSGWVRLPGHVLPALVGATRVPPPVIPDQLAATSPGAQPVTIIVVLTRDRQAAFDRYLRDLYDRRSPNFRHFLSQRQIADRFGPSERSYARVRTYLEVNGFQIVEDAPNRLTLTVRGTRDDAARAFDVEIADYQRGGRTFFANAGEPALPADLAPHVQAVAGLSDFAAPDRVDKEQFLNACEAITVAFGLLALGLEVLALPVALAALLCFLVHWFAQPPTKPKPPPNPPYDKPRKRRRRRGRAIERGIATTAPDQTQEVDGTGQIVGLVEFDTFQTSDVADFLTLFKMPAAQLANVTQVHVNGGATAGANQSEVLIDIDAILVAAPGARVVVYDAPFRGAGNSFQPVLNRMISDGVTVISNSWAYCEDQTSLADVQSIDAILQNAAAAGVSVFSGSGDTGSTCLDGAANTIPVPADSPHVTAVGGTRLTLDPAYLYGSETWWDGGASTPITGQGGFGTSKFFPRPSYQDGLTASANRSVPDVAVNADPATGIVICQASDGGCPTGKLYGGTSLAAPTWAAFAALLNDSEGVNLGELNPSIYPLANSVGFHSAVSMGSDFAHVGLGSPNLNPLDLLLGGNTVGAVDAGSSDVYEAAQTVSGWQLPPVFPVPADGTSTSMVAVVLRDANGDTVSGKTVTLAAMGGSAVIAPPSGVTNVANGAVVFQVTDTTPEPVVLHATDTTDGIPITQTASIDFGVPPAAQAGINAAPPAVTADGVSFATITVTLKDAQNHPTPGKEVAISQGTGHSVITAPVPAVTDGSGSIQFTATDVVTETVTYSAVDLTDGNLTLPTNAQIDFGSGLACVGNPAMPPTGLNGYGVRTFASGFASGPLSFGNVNFGGCAGVFTPAFLSGSVYFTSFFNGDVFKLGASGGAVAPGDKLSTIGPTLGWPVVGPGGKLYATRVATTGDFNTGAIVELDPSTGAVLRNVVSNVRCPDGLVVDPLSGDLFFDDECFGAGSDDPTIHRVRNPATVSPTVDVYATLPSTPNAQIAIAPSGTLYVATSYTSPIGNVVRVTGTSGPTPPTVTTLAGVQTSYWVNIGSTDQNGEVKWLITVANGKVQLTDITASPPATVVEMASNVGGGTFGPDGCLYMPEPSAIYRLTDPSGGCNYAGVSIALSPTTVTPNPLQGTSQSFTATLHGGAAPVGTEVFFQVTGANTLLKMIPTDASGQAMFTYTAVHAGQDTVLARTTVGNSSLISNPAVLTWDAGQHVTFLSLNSTSAAGSGGQPTTVSAQLVDTSAAPETPLAGQPIQFSLGGAQCGAKTDAGGVATCQLTPPAPGLDTLTATFAGTNTLTPAMASLSFNAVGAPCVPLDCDDADGCTTDTCANGQCGHTTAAGYAGVTCYVDAIGSTLQAAAATDVKKGVRKSLQHKQRSISKLLVKAQGGGKKGNRARKRADKQLGGLVKRLRKLHSPKITMALDQQLGTLAGKAKTLLDALPAS